MNNNTPQDLCKTEVTKNSNDCFIANVTLWTWETREVVVNSISALMQRIEKINKEI